MKNQKTINVNHIFFSFLKDIKDHDLESFSYQNKKGNDVFPFVKDRIKCLELRDEICDLNNDQFLNKIFSTFRLDHNSYAFYKLDYEHLFLEIKNGNKEVEISIKDIYIHLFVSGINYLEIVYEINGDLDDVNNANYFMCEIKSDIKVNFERKNFNSETNKIEIEKNTFRFLDLINNIGKIINIGEDIFKKEHFSKFKPYLLTYILTDSSESDINVGHNLKKSYQINSDYVMKSNYFNNSVWYYSNNSAINITNLVSDEITNNFFQTTFISKFNTLYRFLFLNVIHEKNYLLYGLNEIHKENFLADNYDNLKKTNEKLISLNSKITKGSILYFFDAPSTIEHVNLYFDNLKNSFQINVLSDTLNTHLNLVTKYVNDNTLVIEEFNQTKEEKRKGITDLVALLFASIVSFASLYDVFLNLVGILNIDIDIVWHILIAVLFVVVFLIIPLIFNLKTNIRKINKSNEKINDLLGRIKDRMLFIKK